MEDKKPLIFTLYRVQVHFPPQGQLYGQLRSPVEVIQAALQEKPTVEHPKGSWHIGNVTVIPPNGLYFAIGKQLSKQLGELDEDGDFRNQTSLVAPNTHAVLDLHYQVLGIAANSEVAPKPDSVARKLKKLLQQTAAVRDHGCLVSIDPITDPRDFLHRLEQAKAVTKFQVAYGLPNIWDVEEDFQKPFQKTAHEAGSERSVASFAGPALEKDVLMKLTRAASAIGKSAKAWVKRTKADRRSTPISTQSNPATQAAEPFDQSQFMRWAEGTMGTIREFYESIRAREE